MKIYTHSIGNGKIELGEKPLGGRVLDCDDFKNGEMPTTIEWVGPAPELSNVGGARETSIAQRFAERSEYYAANTKDLMHMVACCIIRHHNATKAGKLMVSRYAGECAGTGKEIKVGTKIYYCNGKAYRA